VHGIEHPDDEDEELEMECVVGVGGEVVVDLDAADAPEAGRWSE
jgi:hypothetical protein